jgi:tetratricopeptide (TPR) repeat protein
MSLAKFVKFSIVALALVIGFFLFCLPSSSGGQKDKRKTQAQAHYMMGLFYENQGKSEEAISEFNEASRLDKEIPAIYLHLATSHIRRGELDKAQEALKQAKAVDPEGIEAGLILALLYTTQQQSEKATQEYEEVMEKIAEIEPRNTDVLKNLAALYYQQNKIEETIATYKLLLDIDKDDYESIFLYGSLLEQKGLREEAIQKFKEALKINPDYADALNALGYVYAEEGKNLSEAEELIKKALRQQPDNGAYIDSLGWVYFKMSNVDKAIEQLERASSILSDPVIFDHLGDAYFKKGISDKAKAAWEKSLELDSKQEKVREKLEKLKKDTLSETSKE